MNKHISSTNIISIQIQIKNDQQYILLRTTYSIDTVKNWVSG